MRTQQQLYADGDGDAVKLTTDHQPSSTNLAKVTGEK